MGGNDRFTDEEQPKEKKKWGGLFGRNRTDPGSDVMPPSGSFHDREMNAPPEEVKARRYQNDDDNGPEEFEDEARDPSHSSEPSHLRSQAGTVYTEEDMQRAKRNTTRLLIGL